MISRIFVILLAVVFFVPQSSLAQDAQQYVEANFFSPVSAIGDKELDGVADRINIIKPSVDLEKMRSIFFTPSEQSLIDDARLGLTARAPTMSELSQGEQGAVLKGPRELALGGIVYLAPTDWAIWLNGEKITPDRLPSEILDITVNKYDIKLKWFDSYTNQIFPIKLRTHQRFNIDTRIFLPGEGIKANNL